MAKRKAKSSARRKIDKSKVRVKVLCKTNPRQPGTSAGKRTGEMISFMRKHPKAPLKELTKNTSYRSNDLKWDLAKKNIALISA
jgi:hypothetical protein